MSFNVKLEQVNALDSVLRAIAFDCRDRDLLGAREVNAMTSSLRLVSDASPDPIWS